MNFQFAGQTESKRIVKGSRRIHQHHRCNFVGKPKSGLRTYITKYTNGNKVLYITNLTFDLD